jgi:hypothetical protein
MSTIPDAPLVARLSKDGLWVLCGYPNCGTRLAMVRCGKGGGTHYLKTKWGTNHRPPTHFAHMTPFSETNHVGDDHIHDGCHIVFGPGWWWDRIEDVWSHTKRSADRQRADRGIGQGGPFVPSYERDRARQRQASEQSASFAHRAADNLGLAESDPRQWEHRANLPTHARCHRCPNGRVSRIDKELLETAIARWRDSRNAGWHCDATTLVVE